MYFGNTTLHVSGSLLAHHQELSTVQPALAHFMHVWRPLAYRVRMELQFHPDPASKRLSDLHKMCQCWLYSR